jgi:hypothetical protein
MVVCGMCGKSYLSRNVCCKRRTHRVNWKQYRQAKRNRRAWKREKRNDRKAND